MKKISLFIISVTINALNAAYRPLYPDLREYQEYQTPTPSAPPLEEFDQDDSDQERQRLQRIFEQRFDHLISKGSQNPAIQDKIEEYKRAKEGFSAAIDQFLMTYSSKELKAFNTPHEDAEYYFDDLARTEVANFLTYYIKTVMPQAASLVKCDINECRDNKTHCGIVLKNLVPTAHALLATQQSSERSPYQNSDYSTQKKHESDSFLRWLIAVILGIFF